MKAINILFKLAAIAALSIALVACEKPACDDAADRCLNGATCDEIDGACICAAGYDGDSCSVLSSSRYVKTWSAVENCGGPNDTYDVTITASSTDKSVIYLGTFWGFVAGTKATIGTDGKSFTIASQQPDNDGYGISGSGTFGTDGKITVNYTITVPAPGTAQTCTAVLTAK